MNEVCEFRPRNSISLSIDRSQYKCTCLIIVFSFCDADNVANQKTFLIKTGGMVRFKDYGSKPFFQTFCTTLIGEKYKISIDDYRCSDGTP